MILTIPIDNYDANCVVLYKAVKNNVINNSQYSKLIYSSTLCTFNAIYIRFSLENYARVIHNNKIRYTFHLLENQNIINKIKHIEHHLLHQFYISDLIKC